MRRNNVADKESVACALWRRLCVRIVPAGSTRFAFARWLSRTWHHCDVRDEALEGGGVGGCVGDGGSDDGIRRAPRRAGPTGRFGAWGRHPRGPTSGKEGGGVARGDGGGSHGRRRRTACEPSVD